MVWYQVVVVDEGGFAGKRGGFEGEGGLVKRGLTEGLFKTVCGKVGLRSGLGYRVGFWWVGFGFIFGIIIFKGPVLVKCFTRTFFVICRKLEGMIWHFSKVFQRVNYAIS